MHAYLHYTLANSRSSRTHPVEVSLARAARRLVGRRRRAPACRGVGRWSKAAARRRRRRLAAARRAGRSRDRRRAAEPHRWQTRGPPAHRAGPRPTCAPPPPPHLTSRQTGGPVSGAGRIAREMVLEGLRHTEWFGSEWRGLGGYFLFWLRE